MDELSVSIAPLKSFEVEYYAQLAISISVTNNLKVPILVERIVLRFQTDTAALVYVQSDLGQQVAPALVFDDQVVVTPTARFRARTNAYDIGVVYREITGDKVSEEKRIVFRGPYYLFIQPCSYQLGTIFISFKQPEDSTLAALLKSITEHAAFSVYRAVDDPQPGSDLWSRIESQLKTSFALVVLWTQYTQWGSGVRREMDFCRENNIPVVLLIENGAQCPDTYKGSSIEYQLFDREDPIEAFEGAITTQRELALAKEGFQKSS